jgi:hypothetical protein
MNMHVGALMGATAEGRFLLSAGAITIEIVGVCIAGMVAGALLRADGWAKKAFGAGFIVAVIASMLVCIQSVTNFVAAERMSVDRAKREQEAEIERRRELAEDMAKRRQAVAEQAAKEVREAQARIAEKQLGFVASQMKDATGREKRIIRKDLGEATAKIISELGKTPATSPAEAEPAKEELRAVIVRSENGTELMAEITGLDQRALMFWNIGAIAVLLIVLEAMLFPAATLLWPRAVCFSGSLPTHMEATEPEILPLLPPAVTPEEAPRRIKARRGVAAPEPAQPKAIAAPIASASEEIDPKPVIAFLAKHMPADRGSRADWGEIYSGFREWQVKLGQEAWAATQFGAVLRHVCEVANIDVRRQGDRVYCLDRRFTWTR